MAVKVTKDNTAHCLAKIKEGIKQALEVSSTIVENDAAAHAPVDTGRLRNSLTHQINGNTAQIGSDVDYAVYQECGTGRGIKAKNFLRNGLQNNTEKIAKAFKDSIHE